ncbi:hypothetical protein P7C73_g3539, partial [Tremellales sp. Uapishka_1]
MATQQSVHLVVLIHGLWGSPVHLASAKEVLEMIWKGSQSAAEHTRTTGPAEDPTMATTLTKDGREEELVVVVAGGMTSQLTYDGVDVCASRVAWEVSAVSPRDCDSEIDEEQVDEQVAKVEEEGKKVARFSVTVLRCLVPSLARSSLDTRKSRRRLQQLARTSASIPGTDSPRSPIPSASGLSVEHLRQSIRALERRIESPLIDLDSPDASFFHQPTASRSSAASGGLLLTETQLRIAKWLNSLPLKKYVSWYPHTANAHAVAVVSTRGTIKVEAF